MAADRTFDDGLLGQSALTKLESEIGETWKSHTVNRLSSVGGTSTAYTASASPALTGATLAAGLVVAWVPNVANGGAATLNIDSLGAKALKKADGSAYAAGELPAGVLVLHMYDGTNFVEVGRGAHAANVVRGEALLGDRPGDQPGAFTTILTGAFPAGLDGSLSVTDTDGKTLRTTVAIQVARRDVIRVQGGHKFRATAVVRRRTNTGDPEGDAVSLRVQWLDKNYVSVAIADLAVSTDLTVGSGRVTLSAVFAASAMTDVDAVAPAGTVYARVFVQAYGDVGAVDIESLPRPLDITENTVYAPDVDDLRLQVESFASLPEQIDQLASAVEASAVIAATWAELDAIVGTHQGQRGEVTEASGTHTDPVVGGTVANPGIYGWDTVEEGWKRIKDRFDEARIAAALPENDDGNTDVALSDDVRLDSERRNHGWAVKDKDTGEIQFGLAADGRFRHSLSPRAEEGRNLAYARGSLGKTQSHLAYPIAGYNVIASYGQSKENGSEGWPAKSTVNVGGNKMLGGDVRSASADTFTPKGGSLTFQDLKAQVLDTVSGLPMTDEDVAELEAGATNLGETPVVAAANLFKLLSLRRLGLVADTSRIVVAQSFGEGAKNMDMLRKNHTEGATEWYGRYLDYLTDIDTAAGATPWQILAILWSQGESEYFGGGSSNDRAQFKTLLGTIHADMVADAIAAGQSRPPGFFSFVPGENYTQDEDPNGYPDLFVPMAMLEYSWATKGFYIIGPDYPYTDKSALHNDANGYRARGLKAAMVLDHVVNKGLNWEPVSPLATETNGTHVWIHYNVPVPPLRFGTPYRNGTAITLASRGYRVQDATGSIDIDGVDIFPTMVRLRLDRRPLPGAQVFYADTTGYGTAHVGHGNIRDSENADPNFVYEYLEGSGDYESANIPALVDLPYDMSNWAVPHCLPLNWSRI